MTGCRDCEQLTSGDCGKHSTYGDGQTPHLCPVCGGRGWVLPGFYSPWGTLGPTVANETCRSCSGTGVLWR